MLTAIRFLFLSPNTPACGHLIRRTFAPYELPSLIEGIFSGEHKNEASLSSLQCLCHHTRAPKVTKDPRVPCEKVTPASPLLLTRSENRTGHGRDLGSVLGWSCPRSTALGTRFWTSQRSSHPKCSTGSCSWSESAECCGRPRASLPANHWFGIATGIPRLRTSLGRLLVGLGTTLHQSQNPAARSRVDERLSSWTPIAERIIPHDRLVHQ